MPLGYSLPPAEGRITGPGQNITAPTKGITNNWLLRSVRVVSSTWPRNGTKRLLDMVARWPVRRRAARSYVQTRSELAGALHSCRGAFAGIGIMSGVRNVLALTGSFFMLEVYDRVLPSRSVPTLIALMALAAVLYACHGLLDLIRARILVRIGGSLDEALSGRVYDLVARLPLRGRNRSNGLQAIQ